MTVSMTHSGREGKNNLLLNVYHNLLTEFKKNQIGYSAIAIIGQSCIGSVAAMVLLKNDLPTLTMLILLFLVTIFCMAYNGAVLAQLKPKITFNLLIMSVFFSGMVIIANLI